MSCKSLLVIPLVGNFTWDLRAPDTLVLLWRCGSDCAYLSGEKNTLRCDLDGYRLHAGIQVLYL